MVSVTERYFKDSHWKRDRIIFPGESIFSHTGFNRGVITRYTVCCLSDNSATRIISQEFDTKKIEEGKIIVLMPRRSVLRTIRGNDNYVPIQTIVRGSNGKIEPQRVLHSQLNIVSIPSSRRADMGGIIQFRSRSGRKII